ncbi:MAG: hypothetical protein JXA30_23225 [Deltaproteobacteria bacterium]|nr:hypothetical protein [Deltaproteobacteria bacterium]
MNKRISRSRKISYSAVTPRISIICVALIMVFYSIGCVRSAPFPRTFVESSRPGAKEVLQIIQRVIARKERPIIVGITEEPAQLFAWDYAKGLLWTRPVTAYSAPVIAGPYVITDEQAGVVGRALSSGEERFLIDESAKLVGADADDTFVAVTLALEEEEYYRGLLVGIRNGKIEWERELELPGGVPAVIDDFIVLPWGTHRVSVVDTDEGFEYARWIMKDSVVGHAFVDRDSVYVGQHGIFRIAKGFDAGSKDKGVYYSPVARSLPGQPELLRASYEPVPAPENAEHRVNLNWRVAGRGKEIGLEDGILYLNFYRYIFALDADSDSILWIYQGPEDNVGTAVLPGGIMSVDKKGKLNFLSAVGDTLWQAEMGIEPAVARIRLGDWAPPEAKKPPPSDQQGEQAAEPQQPPSLQEQLIVAAKLDDSRLSSARTFAIEHLARFDNAEVTASLLQICDDAEAPEPVRLSACSGLSRQTKGRETILEAFKRHGSFNHNIPPPPIEALARTAVTMKLKSAAPYLVSHLKDPHTPARALAAIFEAIESLGGKAEVGAVERFLRLHHAEPEEEHLREGLKAAIKTLMALQGAGARSSLKSVAQDPMSMPGLKEYTEKILVKADAREEQKVDGKKQASQAETGPAASEKTEAESQPRYLSMGMVAQVLRPAERMIRTCMLKVAEKPIAARISMVVQGDGEIGNVFVAPMSMQSCVEPLVREYRFPATQTGRQQVAHVVRRLPVVKDSGEKPKRKAKGVRKAPLRAVKKS